MDTTREEILHLRDPDAESDKVLAEMGESLQPIIAANVAAALVRRGKPEMAEQVTAKPMALPACPLRVMG